MTIRARLKPGTINEVQLTEVQFKTLINMTTLKRAETAARKANQYNKKRQELEGTLKGMERDGEKKIKLYEEREEQHFNRFIKYAARLSEDQFYDSETLVNMELQYKDVLKEAENL